MNFLGKLCSNEFHRILLIYLNLQLHNHVKYQKPYLGPVENPKLGTLDSQPRPQGFSLKKWVGCERPRHLFIEQHK